jgi:hypothetical protein
VNESGRIFIEAIADISPGTELVYDYSLARDEPWDDQFREQYVCRCGAPRCRGTLLDKPRPPRPKRAPPTSKPPRARTEPSRARATARVSKRTRAARVSKRAPT